MKVRSVASTTTCSATVGMHKEYCNVEVWSGENTALFCVYSELATMFSELPSLTYLLKPVATYRAQNKSALTRPIKSHSFRVSLTHFEPHGSAKITILALWSLTFSIIHAALCN